MLSSSPALLQITVLFLRNTLLGTPSRASHWRLNFSLLKNEDFFKERLNTFLEINIGSVDDPRFLWDAIKGCIRDSSTAFSSHLNISRLSRIVELENVLTQLVAQQQVACSEALQGRIAVTITELFVKM